MDPSASSTTESSTSLSLRAWPPRDAAAPPPLSTLIDRITSQKGSFRNVSEQSLEDEIAAQEAGAHSEGGEGGGSQQMSESEDEEEKPRKEQLYEAKAELLKFAGQAFNDSAHTLDFISLLMSKYAPRQAELTLSPVLKQLAPLGSLGSEVLEVGEPSEQQKQQNGLVSTGWKLQSLSSAADSLLRAAENLETEMAKEAKYWEQVLAVKEKGWSVCRLPRERHTLAVRFGFLEAAPEFRDKGLAALRRDEDGSIDLDLGLKFPTGKSISVQILQGNEVVAASQHQDLFGEEERSAEKSILRARNNLFDEELFHEVYREARTMTNRGVKCVRDGVLVPLRAGLSMFIELKSDSDDQSDVPVVTKPSEEYAHLPEVAATALRILLAHSHRQNYLRRTKLQPPLTERRPQRPTPSILRPIISHMEHRDALQSVQSYLKDLRSVLRSAHLYLECSPPESSIDIAHLLASNDQPSSSSSSPQSRFIDNIMATLLSPIHSTIRLKIGPAIANPDAKPGSSPPPTTTTTAPSSTDNKTANTNTNNDSTDTNTDPDSSTLAFSLAIRTHAMGTDYRFALSPATTSRFLTDAPADMTFASVRDAQDHAAHVLLLWLVAGVEARVERLLPSSPDEGELSTDETDEGDFELVRVGLERGALRLMCSVTRGGVGGLERMAVWKGDGSGKGKGKVEDGKDEVESIPFFDKVDEFSKILDTT